MISRTILLLQSLHFSNFSDFNFSYRQKGLPLCNVLRLSIKTCILKSWMYAAVQLQHTHQINESSCQITSTSSRYIILQDSLCRLDQRQKIVKTNLQLAKRQLIFLILLWAFICTTTATALSLQRSDDKFPAPLLLHSPVRPCFVTPEKKCFATCSPTRLWDVQGHAATCQE